MLKKQKKNKNDETKLASDIYDLNLRGYLKCDKR